MTTQQKRKTISKKTRFEVFKRDSFKCQYCGKCAPEVILHVDHIHPVSKGGTNDLLNYVTACQECNSGKSNRLLSDDSVMTKQRAQLEELNERREQLEQMLAWRNGMQGIKDMELNVASAAWDDMTVGYQLNEKGRAGMRKLLSDFDLPKVLDCIPLSEKYLELGEDGNYTAESVALAFRKLGGIVKIQSEPDWMRELRYIRGIARNRFTRCDDQQCLRLLEQAYDAGASIADLRSITLKNRSWSTWLSEIDNIINQG